uniref:Putative secreted protein n=1 Tax=Anopheles marajoara TaxID=58244 RepID=A0A2M4CEC5_9DIPT
MLFVCLSVCVCVCVCLCPRSHLCPLNSCFLRGLYRLCGWFECEPLDHQPDHEQHDAAAAADDDDDDAEIG